MVKGFRAGIAFPQRKRRLEMTDHFFGTLFRSAAIAGALAASAYAAIVPLTAKSDGIADMQYLLTSSMLMLPGLYAPMPSSSMVCRAHSRDAFAAQKALSPN